MRPKLAPTYCNPELSWRERGSEYGAAEAMRDALQLLFSDMIDSAITLDHPKDLEPDGNVSRLEWEEGRFDAYAKEYRKWCGANEVSYP